MYSCKQLETILWFPWQWYQTSLLSEPFKDSFIVLLGGDIVVNKQDILVIPLQVISKMRLAAGFFLSCMHTVTHTYPFILLENLKSWRSTVFYFSFLTEVKIWVNIFDLENTVVSATCIQNRTWWNLNEGQRRLFQWDSSHSVAILKVFLCSSLQRLFQWNDSAFWAVSAPTSFSEDKPQCTFGWWMLACWREAML